MRSVGEFAGRKIDGILVGMMSVLLAFAEKPDGSEPMVYTLLAGCAALAGAMVLMCLPLVMGRRRGLLPGHFMGVGVFWAVCAAALVAWTYLQQTQWSREQARLMATGYYDAKYALPAPGLHWAGFGLLAAGYVGLFVLALSGGGESAEGKPEDGDERA